MIWPTLRYILYILYGSYCILNIPIQNTQLWTALKLKNIFSSEDLFVNSFVVSHKEQNNKFQQWSTVLFRWHCQISARSATKSKHTQTFWLAEILNLAELASFVSFSCSSARRTNSWISFLVIKSKNSLGFFTRKRLHSTCLRDFSMPAAWTSQFSRADRTRLLEGVANTNTC